MSMEMSSSEFAQLNASIGSLTANVEGLRRDFERFEGTSREYRSKVHGRLDDAIERLGEVEASVKSLQTYSKDTVQPTVDFVRNMRQRGIGFLAAAGLVGTGFGVVVVTTLYDYWGKVVKLLKSL